MWLMNSQKPAPRSSTASSGRTQRWKKSAQRTSQTRALAARSAASKRCAYSGCASTHQTFTQRQSVPTQIAGQPAHELEVGFPLFPIAPDRGDLRDPVAGQKRLHRDLQSQLEALVALQRQAVEHRL